MDKSILSEYWKALGISGSHAITSSINEKIGAEPSGYFQQKTEQRSCASGIEIRNTFGRNPPGAVCQHSGKWFTPGISETSFFHLSSKLQM